MTYCYMVAKTVIGTDIAVNNKTANIDLLTFMTPPSSAPHESFHS